MSTKSTTKLLTYNIKLLKLAYTTTLALIYSILLSLALIITSISLKLTTFYHIDLRTGEQAGGVTIP